MTQVTVMDANGDLTMVDMDRAKAMYMTLCNSVDTETIIEMQAEMAEHAKVTPFKEGLLAHPDIAEDMLERDPEGMEAIGITPQMVMEAKQAAAEAK